MARELSPRPPPSARFRAPADRWRSPHTYRCGRAARSHRDSRARPLAAQGRYAANRFRMPSFAPVNDVTRQIGFGVGLPVQVDRRSGARFAGRRHRRQTLGHGRRKHVHGRNAHRGRERPGELQGFSVDGDARHALRTILIGLAKLDAAVESAVGLSGPGSTSRVRSGGSGRGASGPSADFDGAGAGGETRVRTSRTATGAASAARASNAAELRRGASRLPGRRLRQAPRRREFARHLTGLQTGPCDCPARQNR